MLHWAASKLGTRANVRVEIGMRESQNAVWECWVWELCRSACVQKRLDHINRGNPILLLFLFFPRARGVWVGRYIRKVACKVRLLHLLILRGHPLLSFMMLSRLATVL